VDDIPQWIRRLPDVEDNWSPELQTLEGHAGSIYCVKFSPDGRTIVSVSSDGTINLWSTTGTLERTLDGHEADREILDVAFSPDGNTIISASEDGTVNLWSRTGDLQKTLYLRDEKMVDTCFSPDGRAVDASYYIREVPSNSFTISDLIPKDGLRRDDRFPTSLLFSPDGKIIVTGCSDGTIQLWDCHGNLQHSLKGHNESVNSVAISPDGNTIASGSTDWTIKLWDPITGAMRATTMNHLGEVKSVIFSPDGGLIASFSDEVYRGTAKVWDKTGALKHALGGRENAVISVAFSPNGALTAMGFRDNTVSVWETDTWTLHSRLNSGSSPAELAFSSDGKQLAAGCWSKVVNVWQLNTGTLQSTLRGHSSAVSCVAFSPDGKLIASGSGDRTVRIWDASIGTTSECNQNAHTGDVRTVRLSPDGRQVASHAVDGTVRLWNADTGDLQHILSNDEPRNDGFMYSPEGMLLLFVSGIATGPMIWDATTGILHSTFPSDVPDSLEGARFSPDGRTIVYHTRETLNFRDTASQELLHSVEATSNLFFRTKFVFSSSGTQVAIYEGVPYTTPRNKEGETKDREEADLKTLTTWRGDRKVTVHSTKTGAIQSVIGGHPDPAKVVKFSPDDRFVASVSFDGTVRLWKTSTGELEHCLQHSRPVAAVAFTRDANTLASLSVRDNTIKVWDTASGMLQYILPSVDEVEDLVSFAEDRKFLTTNRGSIDIEASRAKGTCVLLHDSVSVEDGEWIYFGCHKVLWLPHEYRGVSAVRDGRVVIGRGTGALTFMDFVCGSDGVSYAPV
jgi:WD40 repeat protein